MKSGSLRKMQKIMFIGLPPHSTQLTQPIDVGIFQHMNHFHVENADDAVGQDGFDFDRPQFLPHFDDFGPRPSPSQSLIQHGK